MVSIPAGTFKMGAAAFDSEKQADEKPLHEVAIKGFALGKYEVTREQFAAFIAATHYNVSTGCFVFDGRQWQEQADANWETPGYAQQNTHPAVCISNEDALAYADWLSQKTGQRYRLPTEAEWEYAARAGSQQLRYWGDDAAAACDYANIGDLTTAVHLGLDKPLYHACIDTYAYPAPVGQFHANAFGLFDMLGNVWEWTCSAYSKKGYNGNEKSCATKANTRVFRGGSWITSPPYVRSANRSWDEPALRNIDLGFRLALDL